jgi:hypothetical protein
MERSLSISTLEDMIANDYWLTVHCARDTPPCHHQTAVDVIWLANRVGRDYPCDHWSLLRIGWRCVECGSRKVSFRMAVAQPGPR